MARLPNLKFDGSIQRKAVKITIVFVIVILIAVVGIFAKSNYDHKHLIQRCDKNFAQGQKLIESRQWANANRALLEEERLCNKTISNTNKVILFHDIALSYYMQNDKQEAERYASKGLSLNSQLTSKQRAHIKNQPDLVFSMEDIKAGIYQDTFNVKIIQLR